MNKIADPIHWPAFIKFSGDAELRYIRDSAHWSGDPGISGVDYEEADYLVDSSGRVFRLVDRTADGMPRSDDRNLDLEQVLGLIKAHAADQGSCCVAKLYAPGIADALVMLSRLDSDYCPG